jgi:16S rRNA (guanine527-N7)-methyltransferase
VNVSLGDRDGLAALAGIVSVSRETGARLERYVALLKKWQSAENLVAGNTLPTVWRRHVADSAQLVALFPQAHVWVDLGSGAGFPGMVTAILLADVPGARVHLIESNTRKCAFLRQVIRETNAPAEVHHGRIEQALAAWSAPVGMVSARAVASLNRLFSLAEPLFLAGARGAFHKGQGFAREVAETAKDWEVDLVKYDSLIDPGGVILEIRQLKRKAPRPPGDRGHR